jgi:hypothetical protein
MGRKDKGLARELPASFLRGAIATGFLAALQDGRRGGDLLRSALLGGTALSTAVSIEELIFNKEFLVGKKKKGKNKESRAGLELAGLENLLRQQRQPGGLAAWGGNQQFLAGALIGAAAAYVLGDEKLRASLLRAGMQLYAGIAGGFEEVKEQLADIQAEMAAAQDCSE